MEVVQAELLNYFYAGTLCYGRGQRAAVLHDLAAVPSSYLDIHECSPAGARHEPAQHRLYSFCAALYRSHARLVLASMLCHDQLLPVAASTLMV